MRRIALLCLALSLPLAACDDESGSTGGNQDADTSADTGRDLAPEATDDATDDIVQDVTPEIFEDTAPDLESEPDATGPEICGDGQDNDGDDDTDCADSDCVAECEICNNLVDDDANSLVDCDDPDCSTDINCPERCQNGVDDNANGDVDCDDAQCAVESRCSEPPVDADDYVFEDMAYFSRLQYPPPGVSCCFDFDDDAGLDNNLVNLLGFIPDYDAQANMDAVVNQGSVAVLLEWHTFPEDFDAGGAVDFNIFRGVPIEPAPIGSAENAWADGDGVFQVTRDSFDTRGPRIRFENNVLRDDGVLEGGPHFLDLTVPIPELGLDLTLTVYQARVEMFLEEVTEGTGEGATTQLRTLPQTASGTDGPVTVGGGKLGGYIAANDFLAFLNEGAAMCTCAAPAGVLPVPPPLFTYGERPLPNLDYNIERNWNPLGPSSGGYTCDEDDSPLCSVLADMSTLVPAAPIAFDVDANKNGINESVSVGLYFDLVGASLDDPAVEPEE